jgi:hypothetical protein
MAPVEGVQRELGAGEEPADEVEEKQEEQQTDKKEYVVDRTHKSFSCGHPARP